MYESVMGTRSEKCSTKRVETQISATNDEVRNKIMKNVGTVYLDCGWE
jgi:hypothetical protein